MIPKSQLQEIESKEIFQEFNFSNPEKIIKKGIELSGNLSQIWQKGNLEEKQSLQNLVFPEGILFDFKNKVSRTKRVNVIFDSIKSLSDSYVVKKNGTSNHFDQKSRLVARGRFELPTSGL